MIKATFEKVPFSLVQSVLPEGLLIPAWKTFTVNIEIPDSGAAYINLFDRYNFQISNQEAFNAMAVLSRKAQN